MAPKPPALFRLPGPLRVFIDSPDPLAQAGLRAALATEPEIELAAAADPHTVLVWDSGPSRAQLRERLESLPEARAALVVLIADPVDAPIALAAGADGVLLRELDREKLATALAAVRHGLSIVDAALHPYVYRATPSDKAGAPEALTARELEVLALVADGLSNKRIAAQLGISEHTAKFHLNAILEKLGADSRTQAVVTAVRRGLLWL